MDLFEKGESHSSLRVNTREFLKRAKQASKVDSFLTNIYIGMRTGALENSQELMELPTLEQKNREIHVQVMSLKASISSFLKELEELLKESEE